MPFSSMANSRKSQKGIPLCKVDPISFTHAAIRTHSWSRSSGKDATRNFKAEIEKTDEPFPVLKKSSLDKARKIRLHLQLNYFFLNQHVMQPKCSSFTMPHLHKLDTSFKMYQND